MFQTEKIRDTLHKKIDQVPLDRIQEILDFTQFVLSKTKRPKRVKRKKDPLLDYIGGVSVEPFADNIDEELYGTLH